MLAIVKSILGNLSLVVRLSRREIETRYRGSLLGLVWIILTPLLLLAVFAFVFSTVFVSRWTGVTDPRHFALILFAGLIVFQFFTELLVRSASLFIEDRNYIKRLIFPVEILPVVALLSALTSALVSFVVLLLFDLLLAGAPSPLTILVPLIFAPFAVLSLGLVYLIASLGIFVRDLKQIFPWLSQVLMFMAPVFYPVSALPAVVRPLIFLNPMTFIIEQVRGLMFFDQPPDWIGLGVYSLIAVLVLMVGLSTYRLLRPAFADVV